MTASPDSPQNSTRPIKAWWFGRKDYRLPNGDGRTVAPGITHHHSGPLILCISGLHASRCPLDALQYAQSEIVYRVVCGGQVIEADDKLVCTERTYLAVLDSTHVLDKFARLCALDVVDLWDAPPVVLHYLRTGDAASRAASWDASWTAAWTASWDAPWASAQAAAWTASQNASWDAARAASWASTQAAARAATRAASWTASWVSAQAAARDAARYASKAGGNLVKLQSRRLSRLLQDAIRQDDKP